VIADRLAEAVRERLPDAYVARDEVTAVVDRGDLVEILVWLRDLDGVKLDFLSALTVSDWPGDAPRFWVSYDLRSMPEHHRLRLKVGLPEADPHVPSVTSLFPTANWHEREQYDFFGVIFDGHPDLTRMMLPDDWEGHPLRKDEELGGVNTWFKGALVPPVDRRGMA
jgi:NADH-quinone oxidoreductase subunit C